MEVIFELITSIFDVTFIVRTLFLTLAYLVIVAACGIYLLLTTIFKQAHIKNAKRNIVSICEIWPSRFFYCTPSISCMI